MSEKAKIVAATALAHEYLQSDQWHRHGTFFECQLSSLNANDEPNPALQQVIRVTKRIINAKFTIGQLLSVLVTPGCKRQWDLTYGDYKMERFLASDLVHAVNRVKGVWPLVSNRTFDALIGMSIEPNCGQIVACSVDHESLKIDDQLLANVKLLAFSARMHGPDMVIEMLSQADPRSSLMAVVMPLAKRVMPLSTSNLIKFVQHHGGVPLLIDASVNGPQALSDLVDDIDYDTELQEWFLKFRQCGGDVILQVKLLIDTRVWLKRVQDTDSIFIKHDGMTVECLVESCNDSEMVLAVVVKFDQNYTGVRTLRVKSYHLHTDGDAVFEVKLTAATQDDNPPMMSALAVDDETREERLKMDGASDAKMFKTAEMNEHDQTVAIAGSPLGQKSQELYAEYKQLASQMMQKPRVGICNRADVYKQAKAGHPIGYVLGHTTYDTSNFSVPLSVADIKSVIDSGGCRKHWDRVFEDSQVLQYDGPRKIVYSTTRGVWPTAPRDVVVCLEDLSPSDTHAVIVSYSVPLELMPPNLHVPVSTKHVRARLDMGVWDIQQLDTGVIDVRYLVLTNPCGTIPKFLLEQVSTSFPGCIGKVFNLVREHGVPPHAVDAYGAIIEWKYNMSTRQVSGCIRKSLSIRFDTVRWLRVGEAMAVQCNGINEYVVRNDGLHSMILDLTIADGEHDILLKPVVFDVPMRILVNNNRYADDAIEEPQAVKVDEAKDVAERAQQSYAWLAGLIEKGLWERIKTTSDSIVLSKFAEQYRMSATLAGVCAEEALTKLMKSEHVVLLSLIQLRFVVENVHRDQERDIAVNIVHQVLQSGQLSFRISGHYGDFISAWLITSLKSGGCRLQYIFDEQALTQHTITAHIAAMEQVVAEMSTSLALAYITLPDQRERGVYAESVRQHDKSAEFGVVAASLANEGHLLTFKCDHLAAEEALRVYVRHEDAELHKHVQVIKHSVDATSATLHMVRVPGNSDLVKLPARLTVQICRVKQARVHLQHGRVKNLAARAAVILVLLMLILPLIYKLM